MIYAFLGYAAQNNSFDWTKLLRTFTIVLASALGLDLAGLTLDIYMALVGQVAITTRARGDVHLLRTFLLCKAHTIRKTRQISALIEKAFSSGRESSLHSAIKKWYLLEGDKVEAKVDDFIVDIARGDLLIEVQLANFSAIKPKLLRLLNNHKVRIVYPIPKEKWIVHRSTVTGEISGRRLSPKKGNLSDLFSELIRIPTLFSNGNLSVEVLMIEMEEIWCDDGRGSWRRRGASIEDRKLVRVFGRKVFGNKADFLELLPENLPDPFSNNNLGQKPGNTSWSISKNDLFAQKNGSNNICGQKKKSNALRAGINTRKTKLCLLSSFLKG